jgi:hypothetical protein
VREDEISEQINGSALGDRSVEGANGGSNRGAISAAHRLRLKMTPTRASAIASAKPIMAA